MEALKNRDDVLLPDEKKYSIVELDRMKPPFDEDAAVKIAETDEISEWSDHSNDLIERVAIEENGDLYDLDVDGGIEFNRLERAFENLDSEDPGLRVASLKKLVEVAEENPTKVLDYVPVVTTLLEDDDDKVSRKALVFLEKIAKEHPEEVVPAVRKISEMIESDEEVASSLSVITLRGFQRSLPQKHMDENVYERYIKGNPEEYEKLKQRIREWLEENRRKLYPRTSEIAEEVLDTNRLKGGFHARLAAVAIEDLGLEEWNPDAQHSRLTSSPP